MLETVFKTTSHGVYSTTRRTGGTAAPAGGGRGRSGALGLRGDRRQPGLCGREHGRPGPGAEACCAATRPTFCWSTCPGIERGSGTGLGGQAALSRHLGDRHDGHGLGERGGGGHALRRFGLPDQALRHGRALHGARPRRAKPHDRHRDPPVARAAAPLAKGWAR